MAVIMSKRIITVTLLGLVLALVGFVFLAFINRQRILSANLQCKDNLKGIGVELDWYCQSTNRFISATVPNPDLPPERRLSWLFELYYSYGQASMNLDRKKAWDAPENSDPKALFMGSSKEHPIATLPQFRCPSDSGPGMRGTIGITNYVGIAGLGADYAASLPITDPWSGIFGYERICRPKDVTNGLSNTMAVTETLQDNGSWTAGGSPTVRGLDQHGLPYLGKDGQFNSNHYSRSYFTWTKHSYTTNILFADGSVRSFADDIDPAVFEAMATIHAPAKPNGE
jgi:prepilin-type processing-associated H-X9-DG protein